MQPPGEERAPPKTSELQWWAALESIRPGRRYDRLG